MNVENQALSVEYKVKTFDNQVRLLFTSESDRKEAKRTKVVCERKGCGKVKIVWATGKYEVWVLLGDAKKVYHEDYWREIGEVQRKYGVEETVSVR